MSAQAVTPGAKGHTGPVELMVAFPNNVQVRHVAEVLALLLGCPGQRKYLANSESLSGHRDAWYVDIPNLEVDGIVALPECVTISVRPPPEHARRMFTWHHELSPAGPGFMAHATGETLALSRALIRFFGGDVFFQRAGVPTLECSYAARPDECNRPEDGRLWQVLQERMAEVKPLSPAEIGESATMLERHRSGL